MLSKTEEKIMQNWKGDRNMPLVSICTATYNHEKYIAEALDSFLMQETNFPFEILVRDDCSTDKTAKIVKRYAEQYPQLIKPLLEKENIYSKGINPMSKLYKIARGKYIALCEGDDYWSDSLKLQKQVDFLEKNCDYCMVHTNHDVLKNEQIKKSVKKRDSIPVGDVKEQLLYANFISTLTTCMQKSKLEEVLPMINNSYEMGDLPIWMALSQISKIGYLEDSTAVYRHVDNSVSHSVNPLKHFNFIKSAFQLKYDFINQYEYKPKTIKRVNEKYAKYLFKYAIILDEPNVIDDFLLFCSKNKSLKVRGYKWMFSLSKVDLFKQILTKAIN
jgi:glycosyltransferase involved in cell wall biosynthesis